MDIILHVGAHRAATTSFQGYLRAQSDALLLRGTGFWGPWRTRTGLLNDITADAVGPCETDLAARATGRLRLHLNGSMQRGTRSLIVSDENMLGTIRQCIRAEDLYPDAGARMARIAAAFGHVSKIAIQIRPLDQWWASAFAFLLPRGGVVPLAAQIDRIAHARRGWRALITDLAVACPDAQIIVTQFDQFATRPDALLSAMTGQAGYPSVPPARHWANRSLPLPSLRAILFERGEPESHLPEGFARWMPFDPAQAAILRETYADDLFWLSAGADGLATLTEEAGAMRGDPTPPRPPHTARHAARNKRGRPYDRPAQRLVPDG